MKTSRRNPLFPVLFGLTLTLGLPVVSAAASPPRLLDPAVAGRLESAIGKDGALRLDDGKVATSVAQLKVCAAANCANVQLSDPAAGCAGTQSGAWCVTYDGAAPPFAAHLQERLASMPAAEVWAQVVAPKAKPPEQIAVTMIHDPQLAWTWPVALLMVLVPTLLGALLGKLARGRRKARVWAGVVAAGLQAVGGMALAYAPVLGLWDYLLQAFIVVATAILFAVPASASRRRLWSALALLGLAAGAEVASRAGADIALPAAPLPRTVLLPADASAGVAETLDPSRVCTDLFDSPTATAPLPPGKRLVLHLGDELAAAKTLRDDLRVYAQLELGDDVTAVNRLVPGTSLAAQYLLASQEIAHYHPALVALYPNDADDLRDVNRPYGCCGQQPMLDLAQPGTPTALCTENTAPEPRDDWQSYMLLSPLPYPVRVLASRSALLAGAVTFLDDRRLAPLHPADLATRRATYLRLLGDLQRLAAREHARLVVVGLPVRGREDRPRSRDSVVTLAREVGLDVLDTSPRVLEALRLGETLYLHDWPGDGQLNGVGARLVASWLSPQIRERLAK